MASAAIAVHERPILFSASMVRAIIAGRKTQTRRIVKKAYGNVSKETAFAVCPAAESGWIAWFGKPREDIGEFTKKAYQHGFTCPYGAAGDRLWVRETWLPAIPGSWRPLDRGEKMFSLWSYDPVYRADYPLGMDDYDGKWRPSIHMPRKFSRITLEITDVRAERLNDITEGDACAEGAERPILSSGIDPDVPPPFNRVHPMTGPYRDGFRALWNSIHGAGSWNENPWVWAIAFRKTERR